LVRAHPHLDSASRPTNHAVDERPPDAIGSNDVALEANVVTGGVDVVEHRFVQDIALDEQLGRVGVALVAR